MIDSFRNEHLFLSNFYVQSFTVNTKYGPVTAPTAEHFFQAAKTWDRQERVLVFSAETPAMAKKIGRVVTMRADWAVTRQECMKYILRAKFAPGSSLSGLLLATGDEELIEGNSWHDTIWGQCVCDEHKHTGLNFLGMTLMEIRNDLRS